MQSGALLYITKEMRKLMYFTDFQLYSFIENKKEQICPRCDATKYSCDDCTEEIENTCSRSGSYEYCVYGGLCSSYQEDDENDDW